MRRVRKQGWAMLTKKELVWLERRKSMCGNCKHYGLRCGYCLPEGAVCKYMELDVEDPDYKDAAEFEARVALWLAKDTGTDCLRSSGCSWYTKNKRRTQCPPGLDIDKCDRIHCSLYLARLKAEKEMEER